MLLLLFRQLSIRVTNDGEDEGVIVIQETAALARIRAVCLGLTGQEGLDLGAQALQASNNRLIIAGVGTEDEETLEELAEALCGNVRGSRHLGLLGSASRLSGHGIGQGADGFAVAVHDDLEPGPKEHGGCVDVAIARGDLAALHLESEMLVEADAHQQAKCVVGVGDKRLRQCPAELECRLEHVVEVLRDLTEREGRGEECGHERVLCRGVIHQRQVEVAKYHLKIVCSLILLCKIRRHGGLVLGPKQVDPTTQIEGVVGRPWHPRARENGRLTIRIFVAESVVLVQDVELDLTKGFLIAGKLVEIVPPHRVHVSQSNLVSELCMVLVEEQEKILVSEETLLLDDLGIDVRGAQGLNLGHKKVANALDGLDK